MEIRYFEKVDLLYRNMSSVLIQLERFPRKYRLELLEFGGKKFLAISGSKKGGQHLGGGIKLPDLEFVNGITRILKRMASIECPKRDESKVCFFNHRNKFVSGETRKFKDQWFYRLKCYQNYFTKNGEVFFMRDHALKPSGRGFYLQEFDFPLSDSGVNDAQEFSDELQRNIEQVVASKLGAIETDELCLIRNGRILVGGDLPWVDSSSDLETLTLHKSLFDLICDKLREQILTPNALANHLGLTPEAGDRQLNPNSRYDIRYLGNGYLLDRVRRGFTSLHYLVTQIPEDALAQSPALTYILLNSAPEKWSEWKRATFSNDEYSNGKLQSFHTVVFELDAYEGGIEVGIEPELNQIRTTAIRLFDLKRHYEQDRDKTTKVQKLIDRFIAVTKEADYV